MSHLSHNDETCTYMPYLKKIQKIYKSRDTPIEVMSIFSPEICNFVISRIIDIDYTLIHNF